MSSTGAPRCTACDGQTDLCDACGGRLLAPLVGTVMLRGQRWAEHAVQRLVARWPHRWPRSPRALTIASRRVADLGEDQLRVQLARMCLDAAAQRYLELVDFLTGWRSRLPTALTDDDDRTPE